MYTGKLFRTTESRREFPFFFFFFWRRIKKVLESDVYHKKISLRYTGGAWKQTVGWEFTSREITETFSKMSLAAHWNILCVF